MQKRDSLDLHASVAESSKGKSKTFFPHSAWETAVICYFDRRQK